jgi:hypothetical protein
VSQDVERAEPLGDTIAKVQRLAGAVIAGLAG